jgi:hypothetical protein
MIGTMIVMMDDSKAGVREERDMATLNVIEVDIMVTSMIEGTDGLACTIVVKF